MPNQVYEGAVRVDDKKANGEKLIVSKGDRQGQPYYKVAFKVGEGWVNLMDFEGVTGGQRGEYHVEYYQKFQPNGEPELYNGNPQFQLVDIYPLQPITPAAAQNGPNPAPAAAAPAPTPQSAYNPGLGAMQTALNCATQVNVAILNAGGGEKYDYVAAILEDAGRFHEALLKGSFPSLEQAVAEKLGAVPEDEDEDDQIPF